MPRYRFGWVHVPGSLLLELTQEAHLDTAQPASALQAKYGARPKEQFVADLWPVLRDSWLAHDEDARSRVVEQLRGRGLGDPEKDVSSRSGQIAYLAGLRNAKTLREVVVHEFHALGEPAQTVTVGEQQVPVGVGHPLDPDQTAVHAALSPLQDHAESAAASGQGRASGGGAAPPLEPWPWQELAAAPALNVVDAGPNLLDRFRADLMMDTEWVHDEDRHLWWWGAPVPMGFQVDQPRLVLGDPTVKVTAYTYLVRDVAAETDKVLDLVGMSNTYAVMGALAYLEERRTIVAFTTHYAHPGNESVTRLFPFAAAATYARALGAAPALAESLGGQLAVAPHPQTGVREDFDEMTDLLVGVAARGQSESGPRFAQAELASMLELCRAKGWLASADSDALCAELPYSTSTPAVFWAAVKQPPVGHTSLLEVIRSADRPDLGHGLLQLLHLPGPFPEVPAATANRLNLAEFSTGTGFPSWGAWCPRGEDRMATVTHAGFLPVDLARPGLATTNLFHGYLRSQWAQEQTLPPAVVSAVRAGERRAVPEEFDPGVDVMFSRQVIEDYVTSQSREGDDDDDPTTYRVQSSLWRARLAD